MLVCKNTKPKIVPINNQAKNSLLEGSWWLLISKSLKDRKDKEFR